MHALSAKLQQIKDAGLHRYRHPLGTGNDDLLNFSSNDYLSLSTFPEVIKAYQKGYQSMPTASGGSMLLGGYHPIHQELEQAFAQFLEVEDALLFSSGYAANLAVMALLKAVGAACLIDKAVHASMYDGIQMQQIPYERYRHQDINDLAFKSAKQQGACFVLTEGVFSMSGSISDLQSIAAQTKFPLIVDEAHSFGLLGKEGRGAVSKHQLDGKDCPLRIIPLGKAFAAQGAVIAGQAEWIEGLIQFGRPYIYSTAFSPALAYGMLKTLEILKNAESRRTKLQGLIATFRESCLNSDLNFAESQSAIQRLHLGCPHKAAYFSKRLLEQGIFCQAIRQPSVSKLDTGLRIVLNYHHEPADIKALFEQLNEIHHEYTLQENR